MQYARARALAASRPPCVEDEPGHARALLSDRKGHRRGEARRRHVLPVGPGSLVLIPAGEWHQLVASETGFDYIEFQAPFDFATTMDHDPLGKNWYINGTDDGTGKPNVWVQS